jgi:hypothetical protein
VRPKQHPGNQRSEHRAHVDVEGERGQGQTHDEQVADGVHVGEARRHAIDQRDEPGSEQQEEGDEYQADDD